MKRKMFATALFMLGVLSSVVSAAEKNLPTTPEPFHFVSHFAQPENAPAVSSETTLSLTENEAASAPEGEKVEKQVQIIVYHCSGSERTVFPGVKGILLDENGDQVKEILTDENGSDFLVNAEPGVYMLTLESKKEGFFGSLEAEVKYDTQGSAVLEFCLDENGLRRLGKEKTDSTCASCEEAAPCTECTPTPSCSPTCGSVCEPSVGGGFPAGLIGLAGLAGLAGIGGSDQPHPVSPVRP